MLGQSETLVMAITHNDVTVTASLHNGTELNSQNVKVLCIYVPFSNGFNGCHFHHFHSFQWTGSSCLSNGWWETSRQDNHFSSMPGNTISWDWKWEGMRCCPWAWYPWARSGTQPELHIRLLLSTLQREGWGALTWVAVGP